MSSHLTYRPREGIFFGDVAGTPIRLPTLSNQIGLALDVWRDVARLGGIVAQRVTLWDTQQEFRTVGVPVAAAGQTQTTDKFELYDWPGRYAQRFDDTKVGAGRSNHRHHARVALVKSARGQEFSIHGAPPCGASRCIVIAQGWDSLFAALETTRQVSFVVEL